MLSKEIITGEDLDTMHYAVYDTESDRFVTAVWPKRFLKRILELWKSNHPDMSMARYEIRKRLYPSDEGYDNRAVLIIDRESNKIVAYYHWNNRHYSNSYDRIKYKFIEYKPPEGIEVEDIYDRYGLQIWNGKGELYKQ
ncbi:MAG: hypothetical protein ACFFDI_25050 [Promethearchaeota archaeon]